MQSQRHLNYRHVSFALAALLGIGGGSIYLVVSNQRIASPIFIQQDDVSYRGEYDVRLRENPSDPSKTDIYLSNGGSESLFLSLADIYRGHYHPAEFSDGMLYIIRRSGGGEQPTGDDWTDELWKYDRSGAGTKLYSAQGLDFRHSPQTNQIAIFLPDKKKPLVLMDAKGAVSKAFSHQDIPGLGANDELYPLRWYGQMAWFGAAQGMQAVSVFSLDTQTVAVTQYPISELHAAVGEVSLDPGLLRLAYSDYKPRLDTDSTTAQAASLYIYDLTTKQKSVVVSATVKRPFAPTWANDGSLEYNDPTGSGRISLEIK